MRQDTLQTLGYTGIVTLSQYIGDKKVKIKQLKNHGGEALFDFFAYCLKGDFSVADALRPNKILLLSKQQSEQSSESTYSALGAGQGYYTISTTPEKIYSAGACKVRYSFIISKDVLRGLNSTENVYLGLYPSSANYGNIDVNNFSAICKLGSLDLIPTNAALVVDWELIISNVSNEE